MKTILKLRNFDENSDITVKEHEILLKDKSFAFDKIYADNNLELFREIEPILGHLLTNRNFHQAIVAYGCTSSGKTHTMQNPIDGLLFKSVHYLIDKLQPSQSIKVRCAEIYMENCRDLLDQSGLHDQQQKPLKYLFTPKANNYDNLLIRKQIESFEEFQEIMNRLLESRKISPTGANNSSSRSHLLVFIDIYERETENLHSCLVIGDLAGSERFKSTGKSDMKHQQEAGSINKSLHVFHNVIHAIRSKMPHIPIRDSKLTQMLAKSLIGSGDLTLLITVNCDKKFTDETLHVLEFGAIVRQMKPFKSKVDSGRNGLWSGKKRLEFSHLMKNIYESPSKLKRRMSSLKNIYESPAKSNRRMSSPAPSVPDDWETVIENMVRTREDNLRQEMIMEHAENTEKLRELYDRIMEEIIAETEEKFSLKIDVLSCSYQLEIDNLRNTIKVLENQIATLTENQDFNELTQQIQSLKKVKDDNLQLERNKRDLEVQLKRRDILAQEKEDEIIELKNELSKSDKEVKELRQEVARLKAKHWENDNEETRFSSANVRFSEIDMSPIKEANCEKEENHISTEEEEEFHEVEEEPYVKESLTPIQDLSPIFSKLGLKSAFKLPMPTLEKPSFLSKTVIPTNEEEQETEEDKNDENQENNAAPVAKRKVKLRQKRAVFNEAY